MCIGLSSRMDIVYFSCIVSNLGRELCQQRWLEWPVVGGGLEAEDECCSGEEEKLRLEEELERIRRTRVNEWCDGR